MNDLKEQKIEFAFAVIMVIGGFIFPFCWAFLALHMIMKRLDR